MSVVRDPPPGTRYRRIGRFHPRGSDFSSELPCSRLLRLASCVLRLEHATKLQNISAKFDRDTRILPPIASASHASNCMVVQIVDESCTSIRPIMTRGDHMGKMINRSHVGFFWWIVLLSATRKTRPGFSTAALHTALQKTGRHAINLQLLLRCAGSFVLLRV